jgi:predicted nucleic acid-binding protein
VVVDASAVVEFLFQTERAAAIGATLQAAGVVLHAPALCDVEVTAALRRTLLASLASEDRVYDAVTDYLDLPITRHGHQALLPRILALRYNFSAYDATYVALAERLEAELLTADEALARAVESHTVVATLP